MTQRSIKKLIRLIAFFIFRAEKLEEGDARAIWQKAKACCVVCCSGIGDALMATPLLEGIKISKPNIRVIVVCHEKNFSIFDSNPYADVILKFKLKLEPFSFIFSLLRLRLMPIDVLFATQPSNTLSHSLIAAFSRSKVRFKHTYDYKGDKERDYSFFYSAIFPVNMEKHRVELNLDFLRYMGEEIKEGRLSPKFYLRKTFSDEVKIRLKKQNKQFFAKKLVAIHPGGRRPNKRWLPEYFAYVGKELAREGFTICLVGGAEEKMISAKISQQIDSNSLFDFCDLLSFEETAAILKECALLISNDSGIMHLAVSVGTPVVAIFGPTDYRHIGPFSQKAKIVYASANIQEVKPAVVLSAVRELIKETR